MPEQRVQRGSSGLVALLIVGAVALGAGCSRSQNAAASADASAGAPGALPSHGAAATAAGSGGIAPPAAGSGTGTGALVWTKPADWTEQTPSSAMRKAQYKVPGSGGDAECVVYYFGPGQGGSAEANANRWVEQFKQPDGKPSSEVAKQSTATVNGIQTLSVEVSGTYSGGMGPGMASGPEQSGQMLLGAIAAGPDANWFFKLTGPQATVRAQEAAFKAMIASLHSGTQP